MHPSRFPFWISYDIKLNLFFIGFTWLPCSKHKTPSQSINTLLIVAGSEGFDRIFTPEKLSRGSSPSSIGFNLSSDTNGGIRDSCLESTLSSLEEMVLDSQAKCAALTSEIGSPEFSAENLRNVKKLSQKLESMQKLLMRLRTQI